MTVMKRLASARPRLLDTYIAREMLAPTAIGLLVFTFVLLIDQIPRLLAVLVARSADLETILRVFFNLLPSILAVTIPMAFLLGVLLAFGRLASDSEIVALRAVGVSPARLLVPVLAMAGLMTALTFYINAVALPAANQAHRQLVFNLVVSKARTDVRPRTFTDDLLPGRMMLYVQDVEAESGKWKNLLIHDLREPGRPKLILARGGELIVDRALSSVRLELGPGNEHTFVTARPREYERLDFASMSFPLPVDEFFPDKKKLLLSKGDREMTLRELAREIRALRAHGRNRKEWGRYAVEWHKKFAIPGACLVFGVLGLALSLGSKKEARSSAFALSIAVIFVYYILIRLGEQAGDTGMMVPWLSMWGANVALGMMAVTLLWLNHREAAFDPLDASHYLSWVPKVRRRTARRSETEATRRRPVVVVRIPRPRLTFPSILDRYVARAWVSNVALVLLAFASIFFLGDFMDLIDDFQQNKVGPKLILHYYTYYVWQIAFTVTPVAVLVGVLVTLGLLARRNEITAMKAGGISVYRAALPVMAMGLLASLTLYGMQEWLLPHTNKLSAMDKNRIKGRPAQSSDQFDRRWVLASDDRFYNFDYIVKKPRPARGLAEPVSRGDDANDVSVYGLSIYDVDPKSWQLRARLFASRAVWDPTTRSYELERGWRRTTGPGATAFEVFQSQRVRAIGRDPGGELEPPSYFEREEKPSDTMRFGELRAYIASLEARGFDVAKLRVQLHRKLAFPMVGLVMTLLAVPFSFVVARRGALYGIGIAIVIAIVYWAVLSSFEAFGNNAMLAPWLAAWAPNLLFGAAGLYMILTLET